MSWICEGTYALGAKPFIGGCGACLVYHFSPFLENDESRQLRCSLISTAASPDRIYGLYETYANSCSPRPSLSVEIYATLESMTSQCHPITGPPDS
jgi:hypothetical protein